ncbi:MAG: transglycosylase SLT domain-containing protein [Nannocystaceae bacterium]
MKLPHVPRVAPTLSGRQHAQATPALHTAPAYLALLLTVVASACVCGPETSLPPVAARLHGPEPTGAAGKAPPRDRSQVDPSATPPENEDELGTGWWFTSGPGFEAMLARQHRDHATAATQLDRLLASKGLGTADRGAAEFLRALEHRNARAYLAAAEGFARARASEGLPRLDTRLAVLEAQARLNAGQPARAEELVRDLPSDGPLRKRIVMIRADAYRRTGAPKLATDFYRLYLADFPGDKRQHEARAKLAALLVAKGTTKSRAAAKLLLEKLVLDVPLSDYGTAAYTTLRGLYGRGKTRLPPDMERKHAMARLRARARKKQYRSLSRDAKTFLRKKGLTDRERCEALYLQGKSVFRQRQRAAARSVFLKAATQCHAAKWQDLEVKTRYQAARGAYAAGQHAKAALEFEKLAASFATHSYADDALILAGESWQDGQQPRKAKAMFERALSRFPDGDMAGDARRRLLLLAFTDRRPDDALRLADAPLLAGGLQPKERAKVHYLRGRALQQLGRTEEAIAAWVTTIEVLPLSYPALAAFSRLREAGEASFAAGLEVLQKPQRSTASVPIYQLPATAAAQRAHLLARLGIHEAVREELEHAETRGWPAIAVLARAGLYPESQRILAGLGSRWRQQPPSGASRPLWKLAHPRPFHEIITPREARYQLPSYLIYAIMQTESRFDPAVTSWAGARGLVQLMPATARGVAQRAGVKLHKGALFEPATNLDLGMRYLARLAARIDNDRTGVVLAIPSYNAGAGSVDRWLRERGDWDLDLWLEAIPYAETRRYAQSVLGRWYAYRWLYATALPPEERIPYLPLSLRPTRGTRLSSPSSSSPSSLP